MTFADTRQSPDAERRVSPVFWVLLAVLGTSTWAVWTGFGNSVRFGVFLFVVSGWVVSLCLHEYAHARTALHGGDLTVGAKGYLTLNPFRYANTLLSFVLPVAFVVLGGIGLPGGAVFIERHRIRGRWRHSLISAAGPLVNVLCAAVLLVPLGAGWLAGTPVALQAGVAFAALLQVTATLLNLVPVPGLDGYGIIEPWLSPKTRHAVAPFAPYGLLAVFGLLWQSNVNQWFFGLVFDIMHVFGVMPGLAGLGDALFRFWGGS